MVFPREDPKQDDKRKNYFGVITSLNIIFCHDNPISRNNNNIETVPSLYRMQSVLAAGAPDSRRH